jgi:predicted O-methyltransferase YrrM
MDTLKYILDKYNLTYTPRHVQMSPTEIPNMGRENLPALMNELGFKIGAEIGVDSGWYSLSLCKGIPNLKLYCIDAWTMYADYRDKMDAAKLGTINKLQKYDCKLIDKFSMDAVKDFEDDSLDFVYIDANHELPYVLEDIIYWTRKVRTGGIVAGHDYYETIGMNSRCHVIPAVLAYTRAYKIVPWFLIGTKAKTEGVIRDTKRSWMFVK